MLEKLPSDDDLLDVGKRALPLFKGRHGTPPGGLLISIALC